MSKLSELATRLPELRAHRAAALSAEDEEALRFAIRIVNASKNLFADRMTDPLIKAHVEQCQAAGAVLARLAGKEKS